MCNQFLLPVAVHVYYQQHQLFILATKNVINSCIYKNLIFKTHQIRFFLTPLSFVSPKQALHSLIYSLTHSLTDSLTYSLTHPFTYSHNRSPTHIHSLIHPLTHSLTHSLTDSPTHTLAHPLTLTHPPTHSHSSTHSLRTVTILVQNVIQCMFKVKNWHEVVISS